MNLLIAVPFFISTPQSFFSDLNYPLHPFFPLSIMYNENYLNSLLNLLADSCLRQVNLVFLQEFVNCTSLFFISTLKYSFLNLNTYYILFSLKEYTLGKPFSFPKISLTQWVRRHRSMNPGRKKLWVTKFFLQVFNTFAY